MGAISSAGVSDPVPHPIRRLADERARARRARDWATADRLKAEIEAAGWRVVDAGTLSSLERGIPATVEVDGEVRYGTSAAVPSRLAEPPTARASIVLVAGARAGVLDRAVGALRRVSADAPVVVVANSPSGEAAAEVAALPADVEVLRLASRLGAASALNAGIRRAAGEVVVVLDPRVEVRADLARAMASALEDPSVGVAGLRGLATPDLVRFGPAPAGATEVVAVDGLAMAFHRSDYLALGPLDEQFTRGDYLDAWWSLVLRDGTAPLDSDGPAGADEDVETGAAPRRALVVDLPFVLLDGDEDPRDERLARRHRYRFLKRFATRRDLLTGAGER